MPWNESDSDAAAFSDYLLVLKRSENKNWSSTHDLVWSSDQEWSSGVFQEHTVYESLPSDWTSELSQWEMSLPISPTCRCHGLLRLKDVSEQMGPSYPFKQRGRPVIWPRVLASWPCQSSKWHYDPMPQEMCSINPNSVSYQFNTVNKPQSSCHDWM